jgi:hypothetical protein
MTDLWTEVVEAWKESGRAGSPWRPGPTEGEALLRAILAGLRR